MGALTFLLLLIFRTQMQTEDSLEYALHVRSGERLFHPHHLLFSPLVRLIYLGLSTLYPTMDAILAAQVHNAFWAVVGVTSCTGWSATSPDPAFSGSRRR